MRNTVTAVTLACVFSLTACGTGNGLTEQIQTQAEQTQEQIIKQSEIQELTVRESTIKEEHIGNSATTAEKRYIAYAVAEGIDIDYTKQPRNELEEEKAIARIDGAAYEANNKTGNSRQY